MVIVVCRVRASPRCGGCFRGPLTRAGGRPRRYIVVFESCVIPASLEHEFIFAELPDLGFEAL